MSRQGAKRSSAEIAAVNALPERCQLPERCPERCQPNLPEFYQETWITDKKS
jgi:hypothetical protein